MIPLTLIGSHNGPLNNAILKSLGFVAALALIATFEPSGLRAAELRTVALTGQPAAGTADGVTFESIDAHFSGISIPLFRGPILNDAGQTAFRANITGSGVGSVNNRGVWSEGSGALTLVARTGSSAPGGGTFGTVPSTANIELFSPVLNNAGQIAFYGGLTNGNLGIWSGGSTNLKLVAAEGTSAPGASNGTSFWFAGLVPNYTFYFNLPPLLNDSGKTAFVGALKGNGVNDANNTGIWSEGSGNLARSVRRGSQAVGAPSGVNYEFDHYSFALNDRGQSAFVSYLAGNGVDDTNWEGLWSGSAGNVSLVARKGNPAPGTPAGTNFGETFVSAGINNSGQILFQAALAGNGVDSSNDEGLWLNSAGGLAIVARKGSHAPGTQSGVNYGTITLSGWPLLNDAGQIALLSSVVGSGVDNSNNEGIWLGKTGDLSLVARRGHEAPGIPNEASFSDLQNPALNNAGQTAFRAVLAGVGIDTSNDRGIWATDWTGTLQLVARAGDSLEVVPGDIRTLSDLNFVSASGNSDGRSSGFNNLGQLAFWASFTDGSQAVFVSNKVAGLPGDFNRDGKLTGADVQAMLVVLTDLHAYETSTRLTDQALAMLGDLNGDHAVTNADIQSLLNLLAASGAVPSVPEPASALLAACGFVGFVACANRCRHRTKA